jgi:hypothetical protein
MFTMADVEKIIELVANTKEVRNVPPDQLFREIEECDGPFDGQDAPPRFKFDADEPTFTLRGRDQRAIAAIRYYRDHQSPNAPIGFLEGIDGALSDFDRFRHEHPAMMKQPD